MCAMIDCWKVLIVSGTYFGEPQPKVTDQTDDDDADDANCGEDKPRDDSKVEGNAGLEKDASSKPGGEMEAKQDESRRQDAENTNNNAHSDSEDDDQFSNKHSNSSKYFVTPRPPTSQILLVVYGDLGKTGVLRLTAENAQDLSFEAGQADEFKVSKHTSH